MSRRLFWKLLESILLEERSRVEKIGALLQNDIVIKFWGHEERFFFLRELDIVVGPNKEPLNNFARYYPLFLKI